MLALSTGSIYGIFQCSPAQEITQSRYVPFLGFLLLLHCSREYMDVYHLRIADKSCLFTLSTVIGGLEPSWNSVVYSAQNCLDSPRFVKFRPSNSAFGLNHQITPHPCRSTWAHLHPKKIPLRHSHSTVLQFLLDGCFMLSYSPTIQRIHTPCTIHQGCPSHPCPQYPSSNPLNPLHLPRSQTLRFLALAPCGPGVTKK
jgi:hypothetical protein